MKKIIILAFLVLSGCGFERSPQHSPAAPTVDVSPAACEDLTLKLLAQSGKSPTEVTKTLIYQLDQNQIIDVESASHCLDKNLMIICTNNECKITQKDATK